MKSGKHFKTDILLWATGRTGNTQDLGLEHLGLVADSRGYLEVDDCFQTNCENIFAVGDVIGFPSLASAAYTQGRAAGMRILGMDESQCKLASEIPSGIYTSPEISCIGKTEKELTEEKVPYEIGVANFKSLARAQILNQRVGMLKLLFHRDTLEILGIHCFGASASRDYSYWPGNYESERWSQHDQVFYRNNIQLSDDGGSVSGCGAQWFESPVLRNECVGWVKKASQKLRGVGWLCRSNQFYLAGAVKSASFRNLSLGM